MNPATNKIKYTFQEWESKARELFGPDKLKWKFKCPSCKAVIAVEEWVRVAAPTAIAFSCIGRYLPEAKGTIFNKKSPCDYAGGGLFQLNPVIVVDEEGKEHTMFDFATEEKI